MYYSINLAFRDMQLELYSLNKQNIFALKELEKGINDFSVSCRVLALA